MVSRQHSHTLVPLGELTRTVYSSVLRFERANCIICIDIKGSKHEQQDVCNYSQAHEQCRRFASQAQQGIALGVNSTDFETWTNMCLKRLQPFRIWIGGYACLLFGLDYRIIMMEINAGPQHSREEASWEISQARK